MDGKVHQLSSDDDSMDSLPDLGMGARSLKRQDSEAVDLTLSSDTEDVVEVLQGRPKERLSPPLCKVTRLSPELPAVFAPQRSRDQQPAKKPRRVTSKELQNDAKQRREEEKQRKAEEKERKAEERRQRAQEKEAARAKKEEERNVRRAQKPGECVKLLVVELERRLVEAVEGGRVLSQLQEAGVSCRVVEGPVASSVMFFRADPLSGKESKAEEAVVMMRVEEFVSAVGHQMLGWGGGEGLCQVCRKWQTTLGTPRLSLVVCGVEGYLRKQKCEKQNQVRIAVRGEGRQRGAASSRKITRLDMETALVAAQMECGVNHRLLPDGGKVALYVLQVAKAVAEAPFKREKNEALFSWYAEGSGVNSVRVDKSGVGLYKLWQQQLRQFTNVGVEVAQAVTTRYPSPQALVQAYRGCATLREAERLLEGLRVRRGVGPLSSEKHVGIKLSKKIHLFLTSKDPNASLANT